MYDEYKIDSVSGLDKEFFKVLTRRYSKELGILSENKIENEEILKKAVDLAKDRMPDWLPFNISQA